LSIPLFFLTQLDPEAYEHENEAGYSFNMSLLHRGCDDQKARLRAYLTNRQASSKGENWKLKIGKLKAKPKGEISFHAERQTEKETPLELQ